MPPAISRLVLNNFRNYATLRLECDDRPVVLTGPNGAGKTNILEALSFLAPGRGLRRARISAATMQASSDSVGWSVWTTIRKLSLFPPHALETVEIGVGQDGRSERRKVKIDGRAAKSQTALSGAISILWLTPQMDRLFIEGAGGRRRFLDRLVLGQDPDHAGRASAYDRALRERARLLRSERPDGDWLALLENRMAGLGLEMTMARTRATRKLNRACLEGIGPFPAAALEVCGALEDETKARGEEKTVLWLRQELAKNRGRDAQMGGALVGPHRSDLRVRHATKNLAVEQCSTGEQKAVLIAIMLAEARIQAENRQQPILLLDEVAAHLDRTRRAALFDELARMDAQSWLTGTDEELFSSLGERGQYFCVRDAKIEQAPTP